MIIKDTVEEYQISKNNLNTRVFLSDEKDGGQITIVNSKFYVSKYIHTDGVYIKDALASYGWSDICTALGFEMVYSHKRTVDEIEKRIIYAATDGKITAAEYIEFNNSINMIREMHIGTIATLADVINRAFSELSPYFDVTKDFRPYEDKITAILINHVWKPLKQKLKEELKEYAQSDEGVAYYQTANQ